MDVNMDVEYCSTAKGSRKRWEFGVMASWS